MPKKYPLDILADKIEAWLRGSSHNPDHIEPLGKPDAFGRYSSAEATPLFDVKPSEAIGRLLFGSVPKTTKSLQHETVPSEITPNPSSNNPHNPNTSKPQRIEPLPREYPYWKTLVFRDDPMPEAPPGYSKGRLNEYPVRKSLSIVMKKTA